ncbi:hypothetical protein REC12_25365 [Desulfosporosinus sp. PR]|uniref:hypothetical protein n=1 Tax=Candidatus Desulfosporosinus nitrosoreducens TaxID=3401928 RepID=UPI0027E78996|nr:hypothetical protein [Desulfosporosinus sp. PR]MDQ7096929.1 hypothetical protein [Desulfosporosinus sp. PR]
MPKTLCTQLLKGRIKGKNTFYRKAGNKLVRKNILVPASTLSGKMDAFSLMTVTEAE